MITTETVRYTGRSYDPATGTIELGPGADAAEAATWQLYASRSMFSGVITGAAGMGTSRLLDLIAHGAMSSGCTVLWHIDPQGGVSSPALTEAADRSAISIQSARNLVHSLERLVEARRASHHRRGVRGFTASAEYPGLLLIIDQFDHVAADPEARAALERLTDHCQKVGAAVIAGTTRTDLAAFGGSARLRTNLSHNLVLLHHNARMNLNRSQTTRVPPPLSAEPGYAYYTGPEHDMVAFRAAYLGNDPYYIKRWFDQIPARGRARLDRDSAAAARVNQ